VAKSYLFYGCQQPADISDSREALKKFQKEKLSAGALRILAGEAIAGTLIRQLIAP
jgi:hypothetical protein